MTLFDFAFENLRCRPARTALTVAAIALGIAAVVALTGIAWGFEASWQKANDARGTDLIVTRATSENAMPSPFRAEQLRAELLAMPHVRQVAGLLSEMLSVGENSPPVFVFGWEQDSYLWDHLQLKAGRWPAGDSEPAVALGAMAAELLNKTLDDTLDIEGRSFRIVGVFESPAMVENGAVLMTLAQAQQTTDKPGKVNVLNIKLDSDAGAADIEALRATIHRQMPGFVAVTSGELVRQNAIVRIVKAMSGATVLIAGLVGALVVFNTMLMSVNERTREIGLLLALGWRRRTVMQLIFGEAVLLALVGGIVGIGAGLGLVRGLEHLEVMRGKIDAVISPSFLLASLALAVILGVAGSLYPALRAARLRPAQALRRE